MPVRSLSADNFEPGTSPEKFDVSGKNRDYYTSRNGPGPLARGITPEGTVAEPGNGYRYHVYFAPATIEYYGSPVNADYLVVAAGGGGGGHWSPTSPSGSPGSGGGGAGGMRTGTINLTAGPYPILVGSGGGSGAFGGSKGGDSRFANITSTGGGGGGAGFSAPSPTGVGPTLFWCRGTPGGSGGGGGASPSPNGYPTSYYTGGTGNDPPTTPPQGNPGGNGTGGASAGGGGAGGSGVSAPPGTAGIGRTDIRFAAPLIAPAIPAPLRPTWTTLVGDNGTYASGGRGNFSTIPQGNSTGGGGAGGGTPGYSYTGGGGSGYGFRPGPLFSPIPGGSGGPGIVIIRYLI